MNGNVLEAVIGAVVLVIASFFIFFAYQTSGEKIGSGYPLIAKFESANGLATGADIKISGIKVGIVKSLSIGDDYQAKAIFLIKDGIEIPSDSTAAIVTDGLIGNKFVSISIGFESEMLKPGDEFESTKSAINLESILDKVIAGMIKG
ncbi:MAG: MlaD family protein [Holosporales bacterium]|jgi:phospholipid/cholesterol/gamma-HCH transport system substrate-binding protein|nr:MlaD family protein [Holosporales bacterium]